MPQPHILYVIRSLDIGGTERHLVAVAQSLVRHGWSVSVYSLEDGGPLRGEFERYGVNIIAPPSVSGKGLRWTASRVARLARTGIHLLSVLLELRPDIVHFLLPAAYLFGAPLAIITRVPVRIMSRQSLNVYQLNSPFSGIVERILHQRMHAVLAVSNKVLKQLRDEEGVPLSRLGLIYNGIEVDAFSDTSLREATRAELGLGSGTLVMVIVANLIPYKGHADLLKALAAAQSELPDDWRLLIVGRDDGIGAELRDESRRLQLNEKVYFLGQRKNIAAILSASDVGILCSHQEGFSIALLECMAAGLPMVVTDVGGNAEAVIHGTSGLIVPPEEPASLAEAIRRLANDPHLRARLGCAARQRVRQKFSIDDCVQRHERLYSAMVASSRMSVEQILSGATKEAVNIGVTNRDLHVEFSSQRRAMGPLCSGSTNVDQQVARGFGEEWSTFRQDTDHLSQQQRQKIFDDYFRIFPWHLLPPGGGVGIDVGCGTGRWSILVAPRVAHLHLLDASAEALAVARQNLGAVNNVSFHAASVAEIPLPVQSIDFAYSLGVLHHVPDTQAAIAAIAAKLKPGAPFLVYLYYALDHRPAWYRALWRISNLARLVIARLPHPLRLALSQTIAALVYWPLARCARLLSWLGISARALPLSYYADKSFYVMRTDAYDRFCTRLEKRFTRGEIERMLRNAGFIDVQFSDAVPFWCAVGIKAATR